MTEKFRGVGRKWGKVSITLEFELRQLLCAVNGALGEECPSQQKWPGGRAIAAPPDTSPGLGSAEAVNSCVNES